MAFVDDFDGPSLDRAAWLPHYLPHWSSRAASAAAGMGIKHFRDLPAGSSCPSTASA